MQEITSAGFYGDTLIQRTHNPLYTETREKRYECNYCKSTVSSYPSCHNCREELCQFSNCVKYFEVHSCFTPLNCHPCYKTFSTERHIQQHFNFHVNSSVITSPNMPLYRTPELQQTRFPGTQSEFLNYHPSKKPFSLDQYSQQYSYLSSNSVIPRCNVSLDRISELQQKSFSDSQYESTNLYRLQKTLSSDHQYELNFNSPENSAVSRTHEPLYRIHDLQQQKFNSTQKEFLSPQLFQNTFSVDQHSQQHYYPYTNIVATKSDVSFNRMPEIQHKIFPCSQCNCDFYHMSHLETHFRIHIGYKAFPCNTCGQNFRRKYSSHKKVIKHTVEKLFLCDVCNKNFKKLHHLNGHMRTHTGEKPFSCSECGQKFRQQSTLINHMRIHTGKKPFSCNVCSQIFRNRSNVKDHMKRHTGG